MASGCGSVCRSWLPAARGDVDSFTLIIVLLCSVPSSRHCSLWTAVKGSGLLKDVSF